MLSPHKDSIKLSNTSIYDQETTCRVMSHANVTLNIPLHYIRVHREYLS